MTELIFLVVARYWAWPFLTPFVHMGLDIGSGLLQCSLNAGLNWPPQILLHINSYGGHETNDNLKSIQKMYRPMIAIYRDVTI